MTRITLTSVFISLMLYKFTTKANVIGPYPPEVSMDIVYFSDGSDGIKREIIIILRAANINIS